MRELAHSEGKMSDATEIVHWPGQDTPACDKHARQLKAIGEHMGVTVSSTPWPVEGTICKNCENEAKKAARPADV